MYHAIDACVAARVQSPHKSVLHRTTAKRPEMAEPACQQTAEIVADLLESKQADGLSRRYIETVRSHLVRFAAAFPKDINLITAPQIEVGFGDKTSDRGLETTFVAPS